MKKQNITLAILQALLMLLTVQPIQGQVVSTPAVSTDAVNAQWIQIGSLSTARCFHAASLLLDGRVLVSGGVGPIASAELYDPATGVWTTTGSMNQARQGHTQTLLLDGNVLVAGGTATGSAELYNPATGTWNRTGGMMTPRFQDHTATLLRNGMVLVAGGKLVTGDYTDTAEIYDPASGTWNSTSSLRAPGASIPTLFFQEARFWLREDSA